MIPIYSHSALKKFSTCPKQYYHVKIAKDVTESQGEAAAWGEYAHKCFEDFIAEGVELPANVAMYTPFIEKVSRLEGAKFTEAELAVTKEFEACAYSAPNAMFRGIADLVILRAPNAVVVDYKFGSAKYPDKTQLERMALCLFAKYPEVITIRGALLFIKDIAQEQATYTRDKLPVYQANLMKAIDRVNVARETDVWVAKPSGLCRGWCPVKTCEHYESKK